MSSETIQKLEAHALRLSHAFEALKYDEPDLIHLVQQLQREEEEYQFEVFNAEIAILVGLSICRLFEQLAKAGAVAGGIATSITLFNGQTLFAATAGRGVSPDNDVWLQRKSNTVRRFGTSSWLRGRGRALKERLPDDPLLGPDFAAHGGAFPIRIKNNSSGPIGSIAVSGLTQMLDHRLVAAALCTVLAEQSSTQ